MIPAAREQGSRRRSAVPPGKYATRYKAPRLPVRQELLWSGREGCLVAVHPEPPEGPPRETDRDAYIIGPLGEDAPPPEPRR